MHNVCPYSSQVKLDEYYYMCFHFLQTEGCMRCLHDITLLCLLVARYSKKRLEIRKQDMQRSKINETITLINKEQLSQWPMPHGAVAQ